MMPFVVRMTQTITATEYARRLNVSPVTVRRWAREGRLSAEKVGPKLWRFDPDAAIGTVPMSRRGPAPVKERLR